MIPVLFDCDPGIDDAIALFIAAASPELDLLGVTTVAGNRPADVTARNACRLLDAAGRPDVPVHGGASRPLAQPQPRCNEVHGLDGLGGVALPAVRTPWPEPAAAFLARTLLAAPPASIAIVATGPLTNLALVEIQHPGLLRRARGLHVMGGALRHPGNVTPCAEFNFWADPLAANVVMGCGAPIRLFGLDVTSQAVMTPGWVASFDTMDTRCGRATRAMLAAYSALDPLLHDACPVADLLAPGLFDGERGEVAVAWAPGPDEGRSTLRPAPDGRVTACMRVDAAGLLALVHERIARLP